MINVAWVLLAGEFFPPWRLPQEDELIIAADGGIIHAQHLGVRVNHWLGDFDSTSPVLLKKYQHQEREIFPANKSETDFELALNWLRTHKPMVDTVFIIGGFGQEIDHVFGNIWVLPRFPLKGIIFTPYGTQLIATGKTTWHLVGEKGTKVSIFALTEIIDLSSSGLRWSVENMMVKPFFAHTSRNEMTEKFAEIHWKKGSGIVFLAPEGKVEM